jgi:chromosome segregation ATPase
MTIPVQHDDDDFYINTTLADAQATIAALQKEIATRDSTDSILATRIRELESRLTQRTAERDTARRRVDELEAREVDVVLLRDDLEQRTAELEAIEKILDIDSGKTTVEKVRDLHHSFKQVWESYQDASNEMFKAQAELERVSLLSSHNERRFEEVDKKYKELRTLILTLPKVEGEIVAQAGYVKDRKKVYACFGSDADMTAYAALLTHRQGMEG